MATVPTKCPHCGGKVGSNGVCLKCGYKVGKPSTKKPAKKR
jgi:ribosomal protein L32